MYIVGLAQALHRRGIEVHVLAAGSEEPDASWCAGGLTVPIRAASSLRAVVSARPAMMSRFDVPRLKLELERLLEQDWDLACVHHLAAAWASRPLERARQSGRVGTWMYCAHNDEVAVRSQSLGRVGWRSRLARTLDLVRVGRVQRALLRVAPHVSAITDVDAASLAVRCDRPITVLRPGLVANRRDRDGSQPPRAVILAGSLRWRSKLENLWEFLASCAEALERAGIEIVVAGKTADSDLRRLRGRFPGVRVLGEVADLEEIYRQVRLAVIHEPRGGGFKMKALDYACARVPMVATDGSLIGGELAPGCYQVVGGLASLPEAIVRLIDDEAALHRFSDAALRHVQQRYSWDVSASSLLALIGVSRADVMGPT